MAASIPIVIVGRQGAIAAVVVEGLKPEYDVVHFTLEPTSGTEIPALIRGEVPEPNGSGIGSNNWSTPPRAIVFGGAFGGGDVDRLHKLSADAGGVRRIPWLRVDSNKPHPPIAGNEAGYGNSVAVRVKEGLNKIKEEGKLDADGDDGIYLV